jgi:hypothetical protein
VPDESDNRGTCSDFITRSCVVNVELNQSQARQTSRNGPLECVWRRGATELRRAKSEQKQMSSEACQTERERERRQRGECRWLVGWLLGLVGLLGLLGLLGLVDFGAASRRMSFLSARSERSSLQLAACVRWCESTWQVQRPFCLVPSCGCPCNRGCCWLLPSDAPHQAHDSLRDSTLGRIALASASKGQRQMLAKNGSLLSRFVFRPGSAACSSCIWAAVSALADSAYSSSKSFFFFSLSLFRAAGGSPSRQTRATPTPPHSTGRL